MKFPQNLPVGTVIHVSYREIDCRDWGVRRFSLEKLAGTLLQHVG